MSTLIDRSYKLTHDEETDSDILTITERRGKRSVKICRSFYRCVKNTGSQMGRAYRLYKLTHGDESPAVYDVNVQDLTCDCTAGLQYGKCKHIDAVNTLLETGELS